MDLHLVGRGGVQAARRALAHDLVLQALRQGDDARLADVVAGFNAVVDVVKDLIPASAQVVLMKSDPYDVVGAIELSRATLRKMHQNLWWAVGYNVIAFPLEEQP